MEMMRGEIPDEIHEENLFEPGAGMGSPIYLDGNEEHITEGFETHIVNSGQSTADPENSNKIFDIHIYDGDQSQNIIGSYHQNLDFRQSYNDESIYNMRDKGVEKYDFVVAPIEFGDKFLNVAGEYEGVKNVIDTINGEQESVLGEFGITYEEDGERRPNNALTENAVLTLAGHYDAPQHLKWQREELARNVRYADSGEFYLSVLGDDEELDEMVVDPEEGSYEVMDEIEGATLGFVGRKYRGT